MVHTAGLLAWAALAAALGWWTVVRGPELRARPENPRSAAPVACAAVAADPLSTSLGG